MTRRERLRRAYCNEELDRPCVFTRTGYPGNDPSYDRVRAYLDEYAEQKIWWNAWHIEEPQTRTQYKEPYSADFERLVTIIHTPQGDLTKTDLAGLKNQPWMHETHFLKSREDAEKYLSLPLPKMIGEVASFFESDAELGDTGHADVGLNDNPAGHVVTLFGSELFAIMTLTDRDILHALCERMQRIMMDKIKYLAERNVGPFFGMEGHEYIVPPLHGKKDFDDFNLRYDKPIIDLIRDHGGRMHVHCHGTVKPVLSSSVAMGCDVLHPFEGPPMTDLTAAEAKAAVRGKLCLEGNIQINRLYEATPEQIRDETLALIRDCFDDRKGLIVSPTASPYIFGRGEECFPQYKAMVDAVVNWQG